MKDLTKYYIDLSKCTEEEKERIYLFTSRGDYKNVKETTYHKFLHFDTEVSNDWFTSMFEPANKTELTYPEFIKLFEEPKTVSQSLKEYFKNTPKDQVMKDWESVSEFDNVSSPKVSELFEGGEDNNGWIKIESEADLPKEAGAYYCYHKSGLITDRSFYPDGILTESPEWGEYNSEILEQSDITHYQKMPPIPEPPKF